MRGKRPGSKQKLPTYWSIAGYAILPGLVTALVVMLLYWLLYVINSNFLYSETSSVLLFASFGSSAFLMFMAPYSKTARPSKFVKSYLLATAMGSVGYALIGAVSIFLVIGILMFLLSVLLFITGSEHPPAIGIMLAFVFYRVDVYGILVVISGVAFLLAVRMLLSRYLYRTDLRLDRMADIL
jgi:CBS-domain-containing membrane protein